ncbi:group II intron reverse transcriptase/maturase [Granulosicoccus antarcticus]|uniref:RNA-directed DNA polymerase n=1 Tax=Granulosicoccus antarcticus IMCC3135 TaxID=1192854 RepID=A0A2Z2NJU1_9GAMM|nr:group II intron reverse transcriptase/maturase [Granulosicoccus antarcticus]ASJ71662.1 Group II intron-encoded protein LtrA [Granulosicoccus antarcticus IMCC3135]
MTVTKPFDIPKRLVWEAYQRVRSNKGSAGVDGQSIESFDRERDKNLYKIWNRMSSGSYFPPAVKAVPILKKSGGTRMLGVPTVSDRIAQTAASLLLEPLLEPVFHADSYGYRPARSAHDALSVTRKRCWRYDWVLEYDIRGLFDNIDHELLLKALRHHCKIQWVLLYVTRWLTAPMQTGDQVAGLRTVGLPQGGPLSPILSNLFLHYALDHWLSMYHPSIPFCRYADDGVLHCRSEAEATEILCALKQRLDQCGLELHPDKTRIVYCKDCDRTGTYENVQFDFLGYSFRPRRFIDRQGRVKATFTPAVSRQAMTAMRQSLRRRRLQLHSELSLEDLARTLNPRVSGWINYYCRFRGSEFQPVADHIDRVIVRWAMRKFKRLRGHKTRAYRWLDRVRSKSPYLFVHWTGRGSFSVGAMGAR